jgi:hypothetical protein
MSYRATILVVIVVLCLVGLIRYARGPEHHRGDEFGTHGTKVVIVVPSR